MWTRKELKEKAKAAFKANYWSCVVVALILSILIGGSMSIASTIGGVRVNTAPQTNNQAADISTDTLNINGTEFDLKKIDGEDVSQALDAVSEGLISGKININGEDIDITDAAEIAKVQEMIADLQNTDLSTYSHEELTDAAAGVLGGIGAAILMGLLIFSLIACLIRIFIFNPLLVGCEGFFMVNSREKAKLDEIKRGFSPSWIHNVGAMLLKDIFLFLWSLLFVIPGIIKSYSYAMVPYILADSPELGAREAITLSRKMMNGNKWRAFVLDLSFIGWGILSAITFGIVGIFYVSPYVYSTHAELYNTLKAGSVEVTDEQE